MILDVLKQNGFRFEKAYGQNFLTDSNLLSAIVLDAGITNEDTVLEIGAGAGTLTTFLSKSAKKVVAYEIDNRLQPILAQTLQGLDNVKVVFEDFLKTDTETLEFNLGGKYKVVANLPYYITTPIIMKLLEEYQSCESITVMVQAEVADRLCAKSGGKDYGAITVALNLIGTVKVLRKVSRNLFVPPPNVDSAIIKIDIDSTKRKLFLDETLRKLVRSAFAMRRKTLSNNLTSSFGLTKPQVEEILSDCNLEQNIRGERLNVEDFIRLNEKIKTFIE